MSETQIKTEIDDEFCALTEAITYGEIVTGDIKPVMLPDFYEFQKYETSSKFSSSISQSADNVSLLLRCRLCAMPNNDMVDIFDSVEITKDILEKIEYSLPITVKETDTLPKQICRFCLEELERFHRFRKTVAEADERLLAFEKLACIKSEEMEMNNDLSPQYNTQLGSTEYDNVDGPSEMNSGIEINDNESTITPKDAQMDIRLQSCSVVLSILETCSKDNSGAENGEKSWSNTKDRSVDSTLEVLDVKRKLSENKEESTCDSGVNTENPDDFAPAHFRSQLLKCDVCPKTFKWKSDLDQHIEIHTRKGLHTCQYCGKSFKQRSKLKRHSVIHSEERNYRCPLCDKSFKTPYGNKIHIELVHLNKPWRCPHCGQTFRRKLQLQQHLETCRSEYIIP